MKNKTHSLHRARLKNNCPICFGTEGLEFTFTQDEKETVFFRKPASEINEVLFCNGCNNHIYPVNWTEDIERVFDYNKKIAEIHKHHLQIKPLFYFSIIGTVIVAATVAYFVFYF